MSKLPNPKSHFSTLLFYLILFSHHLLKLISLLLSPEFLSRTKYGGQDYDYVNEQFHGFDDLPVCEVEEVLNPDPDPVVEIAKTDDFEKMDSFRRVVINSGETPARSMRREKDWKRSLACKLLEERHGDEGMDSLWELKESSETESVSGEICCLQAIKLSAGKWRIGGVGRRKMAKMGKAMKGWGWAMNGHVSLMKKKKKKVHDENGDK